MNHDHFLFYILSLYLFSISFHSIISPSLAEANQQDCMHLLPPLLFILLPNPPFLLFLHKNSPPKEKKLASERQRMNS